MFISTECDGPEKRTTISLKDGYTFLVTIKVVYIALYLIGADFLLMNYFRIFHYNIWSGVRWPWFMFVGITLH